MDPRWTPTERVLTIPNPAAGANFSITPNTRGNWLLWSLRMRFVTDANVANRHLVVTLDDGNGEYYRMTAGSLQAASLDIVYAAAPTWIATATVGTQGHLKWPQDGLWIPQGHTLASSIVNLQATDQISEIRGHLFEFPTGPNYKLWRFPTYITEESE